MSNISLSKYKGPWEQKHAIHLLNRCVFGYRFEEVQNALALGIEGTINKLLEDVSMPDPPIHYTYDQDPEAPIGSTWVYSRQPNPTIPGLNNNRRNTLRAWQTGLFNESGMHIREKMVMFWHDHMPIAAENNARFEFQYLNLIRSHALGNFKELVNDMTISPSMLRYLNGDENSKEAPNENYSRELLELFTVGRGLEQGDGDYTNYTEQDVLELAKTLTGWRPSNPDGRLPTSFFATARHDESEKQLSERLGSRIIGNAGNEEYKVAIDAIFENDEVARFICRKLHVWFLDATITEEVESNIIEPMAQIMVEDGYDIKRALRTFIGSEYFNDESLHGCIITSPLDYMFKVLNTLDFELDLELDAKYFFWSRLFRFGGDLEMVFLSVPSVAGWKAYYQAPQFYRYWINSVTLTKRDEFLSIMLRGFTISGQQYSLDYLRTVSKLDDPGNSDKMIQQLVEYLFAVPVSEEQIAYLKEGLLDGRTNDRWPSTYNDYLDNPSETTINRANTVLRNLFERLLRMPEFQLM